MTAWLVICMPWVPMSSTTIPMMQGGQRGAPGPQQGEGAGQQDTGDDGGRGLPVRVGQLAGQVGGEDAARADQPEEPDHRVGVVVRGAREQEGEGRPEHAEGGEGAGAVPGPPAQHRLVDQQAERRPDQLGVAAVRARALRRQGPPEHDGEAAPSARPRASRWPASPPPGPPAPRRCGPAGCPGAAPS